MKTQPFEIERAIIRRIRPSADGIEDAAYDFQCQRTGRLFLIRRYGGDYLLEELIPVGLWDERTQSRAFDALFKDVARRASPNNLKHVLMYHLTGETSLDCPGKSRYLIIRETVGKGSPCYWESLAECAKKISEALDANSYFKGWQTTGEKTQAEAIEEVKLMIFYWQLILKAMAIVEPGTVFKGTFTTQGGKLSDQVKEYMLNYFNAPNIELWNRLYDETIVHNDTLWQAWCDYDSTAPRIIQQDRDGRCLWPRIPGGEELREVLRACVRSHQNQAEEELAQNSALLEKLLNKDRPSLSVVKNR